MGFYQSNTSSGFKPPIIDFQFHDIFFVLLSICCFLFNSVWKLEIHK